MLTPAVEPAFLPVPLPVPLVELLLPPTVVPFTCWLTTETETPVSVLQASPLREETLERKVMSAHYIYICICQQPVSQHTAPAHPLPLSEGGAAEGRRGRIFR
jgi:hypothetical protein